MPGDDLCSLAVGRLAEGYRSHIFTPSEVVDAVLDRIEELNPRLNAYLTVLGESARASARAATSQFEAGVDLGPLQGIPFSVKDNIASTGTRTTAASRVLQDAPVEIADAWIVGRLRSAGAILVGKTNLSEFAFGDSEPDGPFGIVQNPRRLGHQAGTTSSGAGASIAAGLATIGVGTDTAGSVRHPASVCGVPALKPTFGVLPVDGVIPNSPVLDTLGLMARSVDDLATAFRVLRDYVGGVQPKTLRLGFLKDTLPELANLATLELHDKVRSILGTFYGGIGTVDIPRSVFEHSGNMLRDISHVDLCNYHERYLDKRDLYTESFRERVAHGYAVTGIGYARALAEKGRLTAYLGGFFAEFDVIAVPANLSPALLHGQSEVETPTGWMPIRTVNGRFDRLFSLTGFPTLNLPIGEVDGLPISIQLAAAPGKESSLFAVGGILEAGLGYPARWGIAVND